jgi:hypothetical protein
MRGFPAGAVDALINDLKVMEVAQGVEIFEG